MDNSVCPTKLQIRKIYKRRVYYFFLALILFICVIQFLCGSLYNCTRFIVLNNQINTLQQLNENAQKTNQQLRTQLKVYSSYVGIEELARNNLKMVGKDEVLVLIKNR